MIHTRTSRLFVVALLGGVPVVGAACGDRDTGFGGPGATFNQDASAEAMDCRLQCSLDGRSVVDSCSGKILETCPPELACGAGACHEPCAAAAADRSSNGCEFYLQPPRFSRRYTQSCYAAYVVNTSNEPAEIALELQGTKLDLSKSTFHIEPGHTELIPQAGPLAVGQSAVVFISDLAAGGEKGREGDMPCPQGVVPATTIDPLPARTGMGASFHLTTSAPVALSAIYPFGGALSYAPSATLLLPVATWGNQHIIVNAWGPMLGFFFSGYGPSSQIVASEDDTEVVILPTRDIQDGPGITGAAAGMPASYRLGKGQVLQINQADELTGSIVSSNKPTSVFGGHECMYIPSERPACDYALQQLPPFDQWGSEYVGVGYRPRTGNEHELMPYRIAAARNDTRLDYDPVKPAGAPVTMSAGEVVTFYAETGSPFVVRTQDPDHAIYLAAYMSGGAKAEGDVLGEFDPQGNGDPEFVNVVPARQYLNAYSFFADPTYEETSLVIVRAKSRGQFKDVWLECAGGNVPDFRPVGTRGDYEWTRVDLVRGRGPGQAFGDRVCTSGLHRMQSEAPFTATIWGWSQYASYTYPGGMAQRRLVPTPLPAIR